MKNLIAMITVFFSLSVLGSVDLYRASESINIQFNLPKVTKGKKLDYKGVSFDELKFKGLSNSKVPGTPALPYKSVIVNAWPQDILVQIEKGASVTLSDFTPMPALREKCRCPRDINQQFVVDWKAYERGAKNLYEVNYLGDFRGQPLTKVTIRPSYFNFSKGLTLYPLMKASIKSTRGDISIADVSLDKSNVSFAIFYSDDLHDGAKAYGDYLKAKGYEPFLVSRSDLGGDTDDIDENIKKLYKSNKFRFATILGHEDNFPTHYVETSMSSETPSDLNYFLMGGSGDHVPDVFYSRLSAANNDEITQQIVRMKKYESRRFSRNNGYSKIMGIASNEGYNPSDEEYAQMFVAPLKEKFNVEATVFLEKNTNSSAANINRTLSSGVTWVNYIGHGSGDAWSSINQDWYYSDDVKDIDHGAVHPIIIDVACQNGDLSYADKLGERFMNTRNRSANSVGAVAYYGGSVNISWHPPAIMAVGISNAVGKQNVNVLGEALLKGQLHLLTEYDSNEEALENLRWYHLFGDPSLRIQLGN